MPASQIIEAVASEYTNAHASPDLDNGAPLHNLSKLYPADVYGPSGFRFYGDNGSRADREAYSIAMSYRGRPNRILRVYRSMPKTAQGGINQGDWVTTVRAYATEHGNSEFGKGNFKLATKQVHARDLFCEGNSLCEWGYYPQPRDLEADLATRERRRAKDALILSQRAKYASEPEPSSQ